MASRFVMSAPEVAKLPDHGLPEIAFTGRSNVGKSSLVATLVGGSAKVRVSRTPGRTQLLNLFIVDEAVALVDLPGYGYAKLSHTQRQEMLTMSRGYMAGRSALRGVVQILDARRDAVSPEDSETMAWILRHERPLLLAVTKCDLVPRTRQLHQRRLIEKAAGVPAGWALMCSSKTGEGVDELKARLRELALA